MRNLYDWPYWSRKIILHLDDPFRSLRCAYCGDLHNQEEWRYEEGDGFSLTITVELCPKVVR